QYDQYGTGMVFAEWAADEPAPVLEVTSRFRTRDRQIDLSRTPVPNPQEDEAVLQYFRQPSRLIRTDGGVAATAQGIVAGAQRRGQSQSDLRLDRGPHVPRPQGQGLRDR